MRTQNFQNIIGARGFSNKSLLKVWMEGENGVWEKKQDQQKSQDRMAKMDDECISLTESEIKNYAWFK